jgi:predicted metal-dependent peptidase
MSEEIADQPAEKLPPLTRDVLDETLANMFSSPKFRQTYTFYGHMISQCSMSIERMKGPAAVSFHLDHYRLHIDPTHFDKFTLEERLFILKHEMLHILNGHTFRKEDRDHVAFNYATDCAINQLCDQAHVVQGAILPANFPSKHKVPTLASSEQYYAIIDKSQIPPEEPQYAAGGGHDKWADSIGDEELQADITKNMIEQSIQQTAKSRGDTPSEIAAYLELFSRKAELDWRKVLRNITGNKKVNSRRTIMRKDRRNPNFDHIKGRTKDRMFDLLVIGDESGSVSDTELTEAISEIVHICNITRADLDYIAIDTHAKPPIKLKKTQRSFTRQACGGTNLHPALDMAKQHNLKADAIVVITDGGLSSHDVEIFNQSNKRIIWLITSQGSIMSEMTEGRMSAFKLTQSS